MGRRRMFERAAMHNLLACLGKILRYAHETEAIASVPKIELLKLEPPGVSVLGWKLVCNEIVPSTPVPL